MAFSLLAMHYASGNPGRSSTELTRHVTQAYKSPNTLVIITEPGAEVSIQPSRQANVAYYADKVIWRLNKLIHRLVEIVGVRFPTYCVFVLLGQYGDLK